MRLPLLDRLRIGAQVAADAEHLHLVAEPRRVDHVVLGLPLGARGLLLARVVGRHQALVDEGQHAQLATGLLHAPWLTAAPGGGPLCRRAMVLGGEQRRELEPRLVLGPASRSPSSRQRVDDVLEHLVDHVVVLPGPARDPPAHLAPIGARKRAAGGFAACSGASENSARRSRS